MTMNSYKEIGGYFGLDINNKNGDLPPHTVALNIARNCLRYVIKAYNISELWVPYYTCPVVWQAVEKENCKINFYHINKSFMPETEFGENDFILYTNYFGICAENVKKLAKKYKNLIVDNAQAYYMPFHGIASFNSARKFFGVPDGAFLQCKKKLDTKFDQDKTSINRFSHLLKRIDENGAYGYEDFKQNDKSLENEDIKIMSNITKALIKAHNCEDEKIKRLENFNFLHKHLKSQNDLKIELGKDDVPMVYPFLTEKSDLREKLIKNKIYVAKYWSGVKENIKESDLVNNLLPLPIDQRYDKNDMKIILSIVKEGK